MDNDDAAESEEEHQWGGSQMISLLTQTLPPGNFWLNFLFYECDVFDIRTVKDFYITQSLLNVNIC